MRLVASVMVGPGEQERYLDSFLSHLLEFCDEVRVRSEDLSARWPSDVRVLNAKPSFFAHEGRARQELLAWTMRGEPTHILSIDADEFVSDGKRLRQTLVDHPEHQVYTLCMQEIWSAGETLKIRMDGGWRPHAIAGVWAPGRTRDHSLRNTALACGRVPAEIDAFVGRNGAATSGVEFLHFGWANQSDRAERYARYVTHDGGNYHASRHLDSIMWPDSQVTLCEQAWPPALRDVRDAVRRRAERS